MRKDINEKMKKEYFYYPKYENDPKKKNLGKYEKKTYRSQIPLYLSIKNCRLGN
jgi:hypothetical protein